MKIPALGQAAGKTQTVTLADQGLVVQCAPGQGCTITSLADPRSGAEALWTRSRPPAPCVPTLGPAGAASVATFIDVFAGGWFAMFPAVGFPVEDDPTSLLHGELVRLPWEVVERGDASLTAQVDTVRTPFRVVRSLAVADGTLVVTERIENRGGEAAPYAWGHHPCFARETFAGGTIELSVGDASVPDPPYDPTANVFAAGPVAWPDVAHVPEEPDGRVDHVCVTPTEGRARITAPRFGTTFELTWELASFPHLLMWQNFRGLGGWPFWAQADTFALEPSTNPGRTMAEAAAAGGVRQLAPGASVEATLTASWIAA